LSNSFVAIDFRDRVPAATKILSLYIAIYIHMCRAHFYRAIKDWVMSKERPNLTNMTHLQNMFKRVAVEISQCPSQSFSMTMLCAAIVIVKTEYIEVDSFDIHSSTRDGPDEDAIQSIASRMESQLTLASRSLLIDTAAELKKRLDHTMKMNDTRHEKFMCSEWCESVMKSLEESMTFAHAYLFSKDESTGYGVIRIHIIYGFHSDSSNQVIAVSAGFFEVKVDLRNFDGKVLNPFFFESGGVYLELWLRESAIWGRCDFSCASHH